MNTVSKQLNNVAVSRSQEEWPERWIWKWDGVFSQFPEPGGFWLRETIDDQPCWMAAIITPLTERRGNWNWDGIASSSFADLFQWVARCTEAGWMTLRSDALLRQELDRLWQTGKGPPLQTSLRDPLTQMVLVLLGPLHPETASLLGAVDLVTSHSFAYTTTSQNAQTSALGSGNWILDSASLAVCYARANLLRKLTGAKRNEAVQTVQEWLKTGSDAGAIHAALSIQTESMELLPPEIQQDADQMAAGFDLARQVSPRFLSWIQKQRDPVAFLQKPERLQKLQQSGVDASLVIPILGASVLPAIESTTALFSWWLKAGKTLADQISAEELWEMFALQLDPGTIAREFIQYLESTKQKVSADFVVRHLPLWASLNLNSYTILVSLCSDPSQALAACLEASDEVVQWALSESKTRESIGRSAARSDDPAAFLGRVKGSKHFDHLWKSAAAEANKLGGGQNLKNLMQHAPESANAEPQFASSIYISQQRTDRVHDLQKAIQTKQLPAFVKTLQGDGLIDACRILVEENLVDAVEFRDQVFLHVYRASAQTAAPLCDLLWKAAESEGLQNDLEFWAPLAEKIKDLRADLPESMLSRRALLILAAFQQRRGDDALNLLSPSSLSVERASPPAGADAILPFVSEFTKKKLLHLGSCAACLYRLTPDLKPNQTDALLKPLLSKCTEKCNCLSAEKDFAEWLAARLESSTFGFLIDAVKYPDFLRGLLAGKQRSKFFQRLLSRYGELEAENPEALPEWEAELAAIKTSFDMALIEWTLSEMEKNSREQNRQLLRFLGVVCLSPERNGISPKELRETVSDKALMRKVGPVSALTFYMECRIESVLRRLDHWTEFLEVIPERFVGSVQTLEDSTAASGISVLVLIAALLLSYWFLPSGVFLILFALTVGLIFFLLRKHITGEQ